MHYGYPDVSASLRSCYFASFSAHVSQYFSMSVAPSTLNNASWVAMLPQLTQNFALPPTSTNDLNNEKIFSILLFHPCKDLINCTYCIRSNHNSIQLFEYKNLTCQCFINKCKKEKSIGRYQVDDLQELY